VVGAAQHQDCGNELRACFWRRLIGGCFEVRYSLLDQRRLQPNFTKVLDDHHGGAGDLQSASNS